MQVWVLSIIAVLSFGLNAILTFRIEPRRARTRWYRDRVVEHVVDLLRVSRDLRIKVPNRANPAADAATANDIRAVTLKLQADDWHSIQPLLDSFPYEATDVLQLLRSNLVEPARDITQARAAVLFRLKTAVDRNTVVYGGEYGELLAAWEKAEDRFLHLAQRELLR